MCVVSMISDDFTRRIPTVYPWIIPNTPIEDEQKTVDLYPFGHWATKQEVEKLREEVKELKELLKQAQLYDQKTKQPNCEDPNKLQLILWLAKALGVDFSDLKLNE